MRQHVECINELTQIQQVRQSQFETLSMLRDKRYEHYAAENVQNSSFKLNQKTIRLQTILQLPALESLDAAIGRCKDTFPDLDHLLAEEKSSLNLVRHVVTSYELVFC